jgi:hypothetical protein
LAQRFLLRSAILKFSIPVSPVRAALCACVLTLLAACGGGSGQTVDAPDAGVSATSSTPGADTTPSFLPTDTSPPSTQTIARQKEGARLNSEELAQIAKTGVLPKAFEGPLLSGAEEGAASGSAKLTVVNPRTAVYRFFNTKTNAHFFTTSTTERDNVQATLPFMSFEGPAFYAASTAVPGLSPVHRFYNTQTGVHFYTISESERALVAATLPQFHYEGIAYYASTLPGTGYTPLYRFFYSTKGFHFYTNSQSERDNIIATLPQYSYEGVGYYVLGSDWKVPAIPHSGVTSDQCYQAGSDVLVPCASAGAQALNPQQDGHRVAINPMSYGGVPGHKPLDSCVLDKVTGLIWEVKTASGLRSGDNLYTNYSYGGLPGDSSGYVAAINTMQLCGFNDWRMPTTLELHSLVDYSVVGTGPRVKPVWFPNAKADSYWSSDLVTYDAGSKWSVDFDPTASHVVGPGTQSYGSPVRLVRGVAWSGPRYVIDTRIYSGDGPNNVVIDRHTGLAWRRCEEGRKWDGDMCAGVANSYTNEEAMVHAGGMQAGWRLPNVKELESLVDRNAHSPAVNATAFPGAMPVDLWSSSPQVTNSSQVMVLDSDTGWGTSESRVDLYGVRLVSTSP